MKEHFINGINNNDMMTEIIMELTTIRNTNEIIGEQVYARLEDLRHKES